MLTCFVLGLAGAGPAWAGTPFSEPFANASFEGLSLAGWETVLPRKPLPPSLRQCSASAPKAAATTKTLDANAGAVTDTPSLGGNYWHVPVEVTTVERAGKCVLRLDAQHGAVHSPLFTPTAAQRYLSLTARGRLNVTVLGESGASPVPTQRASDVTRRLVFDLHAFPAAARKNLRLLILRTGDAAETFIDDLQLSALVPAERGGAPLFGFVDLHTHPFSQIGSGGRMFSGRVHSCIGRRGAECKHESVLDRALASCQADHGAWGAEGVTTVVPEMGHNAGGYPDFKGWPKHTTLSHQQMYVDWLKRSWQGGLRVFMMDVGHNAVMAWAFKTTSVLLPGDAAPNGLDVDDEMIRLQVAAAKAFAQLPDVRGWLEVAYSAEDSRRIVAEGKLAMVLGVELDNFGRFNSSKEFWALTRRADAGDAAARTELRRQLRKYLTGLHEQGVRHFFPIHVFDSVFGGAALYDLKLEAGTYVFHKLFGAGGRWSEVRNAWDTGDDGRGIYTRMDLEFGAIGRKVNDLLSKVELAQLFTNPAVALPILVVAAPLVLPLIAAVPVVGPMLAASLPVLAQTVHLIASAVLKLEKELGLRQLLAERNGSFQKALKGHKRHGLANARGLSAAGVALVDEALRLGMMLDVSHMSDRATDETLAVAEKAQAPLLASHTGFRETRFGTWRGQLSALGDFQSPKRNTDAEWSEVEGNEAASLPSWIVLGTGKGDGLANERSLSRRQVKRLRALGGMVGVGAGQGASPLAWKAPSGALVRPDCDGSSKTFAQEYLYAVEHMGGKGLALGTDANGFAGAMGARFGTFACAASLDDPLRKTFGNAQAAAQKNGVRYVHPAGASGLVSQKERFLGPVTLRALPPSPDGFWDLLGSLVGEVFSDARSETAKLLDSERAIWWGIAQFMAGKAPAERPFGCDAGNRGLERDAGRIAWGLRQAQEGRPRPGKHCGPLEFAGEGWDTNADSKAAWDVFKKRPQSEAWDKPLTDRLRRVWAQWQAMEGDNPPLQRSKTGNRDFDFNVDGLAHYGLLPDLLQDLRNIGLRAKDLAPLFRGAEDFARMWTKVEAAAEALRTAK